MALNARCNVKILNGDHFTSAWMSHTLGRYAEAHEQLDKLAPELQYRHEILELRWHIFAGQNQWASCVDVAHQMTSQNPAGAWGWVYLAESVKNMTEGTLQMGYDILTSVVRRIGEPILLFTIAHYSAQLGRPKETQEWLTKAHESSGLGTFHLDMSQIQEPNVPD